jgi:hypothetical protein
MPTYKVPGFVIEAVQELASIFARCPETNPRTQICTFFQNGSEDGFHRVLVYKSKNGDLSWEYTAPGQPTTRRKKIGNWD